MNAGQLNQDLHHQAPSMRVPEPGKKQATKTNKGFEEDENESIDDSDSEKPSKRSGRRKIKIEYIEDKNRRHITFSKRKAGIMKKAYELSTLTGTQVLLLVVSETGLVYTFTTVKLQPIVTKPEGKNLIQACLNAPDPVPGESSSDAQYSNNNESPRVDEKKYEDKKMDPAHSNAAAAAAAFGAAASHAGSTAAYQPAAYAPAPTATANQMPVGGNGYPSYMGAAQYQQQPSSQQQPPPSQQPGQGQQQPQQQQQYSQIPAPPFYGAQQHHYMSGHPSYWHNSNQPMSRPDQPQQDDKQRVGAPKK
ncbi:hypothetical protein BCR43DRAFT_488922 [Syncephalastrum racemosum]|uniref:MADS-box domain-containing protein n=1 Tax=Syncephalastrum racemosum TaxID=13706 RepID=A0A1X2HJF0_SYNRA|nr:hypothetical protein BCR43DRAFT_488922 [Syncephalastrum racemosum]